MFETLLATADTSVGRLTLDRPEKLNPLSTQTLTELAAAARWFDQHPPTRWSRTEPQAVLELYQRDRLTICTPRLSSSLSAASSVIFGVSKRLLGRLAPRPIRIISCSKCAPLSL